MWTEFQYQYRDAGNYKSNGAILLSGSISPFEMQDILAKLSDAHYFIAEQLGVPSLYHELERWSDGPTKDDHCWHEFSDFVEHSQLDPSWKKVWGSGRQLVERFRSIRAWKEHLSPNFEIGGW